MCKGSHDYLGSTIKLLVTILHASRSRLGLIIASMATTWKVDASDIITLSSLHLLLLCDRYRRETRMQIGQTSLLTLGTLLRNL